MTGPEDPVSIPVWVMQALVIPIVLGILWVLYQLGLREMTRWQKRIEEVQQQQKKIKQELREVRQQMGTDHGDVEQKLEQLIEQMT